MNIPIRVFQNDDKWLELCEQTNLSRNRLIEKYFSNKRAQPSVETTALDENVKYTKFHTKQSQYTKNDKIDLRNALERDFD